MQQVADRPFMLSEWIHVYPNEWGVEGPALIGAYGMGLQAWDVSYMFQNRDKAGFSQIVGRDPWDVTAPQVLGIFPAVARQVRRGDVKPSEVRATRYVHLASFGRKELDFEDRTKQQYDVKSFDSDKIPAGALAVVRSVVQFTDTYRETPALDLSRYTQGGVLVSSTGQLRWTPGRAKQDGYFTIDTDATKAVVGFASDVECQLDQVTVTPKCRFSAIYVTAREPDKDITSSRRLLVAAVARARNTGMKFNAAEDEVLERGAGPVLMEPVKARIEIRKGGRARVFLLDHDGRRTDQTLPVSGGAFEIDGARDKTPYYLVEY